MKILTNKQYENLIKELSEKITQLSYDEGYKDGLHKGLIADKNGVILNGNGIYVFENGKQKLANISEIK